MHVPDSTLPELLNILQCKVESFPQSYLGLPLSNEKLNLSAFAPAIRSSDRYLAGWQARLLNATGREVLVDTVLDSALTYIMSVLQMPVATVDHLERNRRSFFWSSSAHTMRAQCLVTWERVC